ncbi:flagellar FlbD family protein [Alkalihalobacillus sp. 1P02AB]|uniref:flagellar FlbD family protein n=1 Tax=Alkalihalobacillus sp. 1P02AB TaxID=3132260 RepID=UPI0039A735C7
MEKEQGLDLTLAHKHMMIELIRLNGKPFLLNALQIEQIETFPDTTITLLSGKKIIVKDDFNDVHKRINQLYQSIGLVGLQKEMENRDEKE